MKKKIFSTLIKAVVIVAIIIIFVLINEQITEERKASFKIAPDSENFCFQVEKVYVDDAELKIRGWFFELKKVRNIERTVMDSDNLALFLYNMDLDEGHETEGSSIAKKGIRLKVSSQKRKDINEYFRCEYDYSNCGFIGSVDKDQVDMKNGRYQIVLKQDENLENGIVLAYIMEGRLMYIDPADEIDLNVKGTDLEKVVKEGTCVMSSPEYNICVYQYGWKLYWIAGRGYCFDKSGSTTIQYQMDTTQFDKLPKSRIEKGHYWSNLGASFEGNEITNTLNCGEYRVSVRDLPNEYSLTRIETGYHTDGMWVWKQYFRPDYRLIGQTAKMGE